ncbi:Pet8p KNAG_0H01700 [Huiozyma naganishii CBS 8797]|uniref:Putative mitochondrial carrier protein PET8 n=1 Tax=Huiozyma naganishii (strain ATCC MYA-139 / BCRC 22969 / CBS 8797 / KCTC 17520 / NBRC 10181 / NCYC 3082 / Yp74L-3) TaxID=1071383 RepID=J7R9P8_HUIN7|nr:hypothetical protein KNAG_0H01700 [Kazachstania naganishii CBS 8797]CCK71585.1 hypothetical protein KNAG_0H01700 [Kazachstania naganishii CBS 8797]
MALNGFLVSLLSGVASGISTDLVFFPIDTLKTRLQAKGGFFANGGCHNIYRGVGSAIVASAPSASLFFVTYDSMKIYSRPFFERHIRSEQGADTAIHMFSSSMGEIAACTVRVPAEVIKQKTQTGYTNSSYLTLKQILKNQNGEGLRRNLYRGWSTTLIREIPFTCIQFPLYEYLKKKWSQMGAQDERLPPWKGALCGSVAGGVAAALTTPLDFIKTRLMLNSKTIPATQIISTIWKEEGGAVFLSGIGPRTLWISAGGAIFLGVYETVKYILVS